MEEDEIGGGDEIGQDEMEVKSIQSSTGIHDDDDDNPSPPPRKGEEEEDAFHKTYQFKTSRKTYSSSCPTDHLFYHSNNSSNNSLNNISSNNSSNNSLNNSLNNSPNNNTANNTLNKSWNSISKALSAPSSAPSSVPSSFHYFSSPPHRDGEFEIFNEEDDIHYKTPFMTWKSILYETVRMQLVRQKYVPKKILQLISRHPYTPLSILEDFPFLKWEYDSFYDHPLMNETFLYEYQAKYRRRVFFLSNPPGLMGRLPSSPFEWEEKENHRLDWVEIEKSGLEEKKKLSHFPSLPLSLVLLNPHKAWDYPFLLLYREWTIVQLDLLLNSYRIPWKLFSRNHFLTLEILYEFIDKPWDWKQLALHPRFPPQLILQHSLLKTKWNWKHSYKHPRINFYAWNYLRNTLHHQPFHSSFLLANSFQYCSELRVHAFLLLQKNIRFYHQRKVFEKKRKFLTQIIRTLPLDMTHSILSYYISNVSNVSNVSIVSNV